MTSVHEFPNPQQLAVGSAEQLIELVNQAIADHGRFSVALSGGSTPKSLYELLATPDYAQRVNWEQVYVFWGDERCVPPDHVDSCYLMAREALLDHVPLPANNIRRIQGELPPDEAAAKYERVLHHFFGDKSPRFDLILLGMGDDGHTASLFPDTKALHEETRWVIENYVEVKQMWRITLTKTAINAAANVMFLVSGSGKAEKLHEVIQGTYTPFHLPSQLIQPQNGNLMWFVDHEAAQLLI